MKRALSCQALTSPEKRRLQIAGELLCIAIKAEKPKVPEAVVIGYEAGQTLEIVPLAAVPPQSLKCQPQLAVIT